MNRRNLLSKKRLRSDSKSSSFQNNEKDSPKFDLNGFNIVELLYTESLSKNKLLEDDIIYSQESYKDKIDFEENKDEIKDIMTRTKLKEIEQHFISQYGIKQVNENCSICLMNNFLSNELLYFTTRQNLFNYCKHCFINKAKNIFIDKKICNKNKEQFFSVSQNFINSWRFFIPKTVCKGCFMQLINKKDLIYDIKKIFSDTDMDSSCKTNYRNYAKFSKLFRKEFRIEVKKNKNKKDKSLELICIKKKPKIETIEISDSETIDINTSINNKSYENFKSNPFVEYDSINNIIIISKSIFNDTNNNKNDNKKEYILQNNKKEKQNTPYNVCHSEQKAEIKNIITFQGNNYINIINHINVNADNSINNNNLIENYFELIIEKIKNLLLEFNKFTISLKNLKDSLLLIYSYLEEAIKKLYILIIYKVLFKNTTIYEFCNYLFYNFQDNKNNFDMTLLNLKQTFNKAIDFIDNLYKKIDDIHFNNKNEKIEILSKIELMKLYLNENSKYFDIYNEPINNFIQNYHCLLNLIYQLINPM